MADNLPVDPSWKNQNASDKNLEALMHYITQLNAKIKELENRLTASGG